MTMGTFIWILLIGGVLFMMMRKGGGCCGGGGHDHGGNDPSGHDHDGHDHSGHEHGGSCDMKHHEGHTEQRYDHDRMRVTEIKDPVCGMNVKDNSISHVHEGETYSFCSENCKEKFVGNPTDFIK